MQDYIQKKYCECVIKMLNSTKCVCRCCEQADYTGKRWGDLIYPDYDAVRLRLSGQCPYMNRLIKRMDQLIKDEDNGAANQVVRTLMAIET